MTDQLAISTDGRLGRIALNRPAAINALSGEMIAGITAALRGWRDDPAIGAVLLTGNGEKGFCAGGDVRAARAHVVAGEPGLADAYFAAEYEMNGLIAEFPKPLVVLSHGIVMGGGIGIAGHCRFRFTQPGARFAMPEAGIGFFSDVGVNAILSKAPLHRALLFLMSGASVGAADALELGLADAALAPEVARGLGGELAAAAATADPGQAIVLLMEAHSIGAGATPFCDRADRLEGREIAGSASEFLAQVSEVSELADIAALLGTRSPTALSAIFASHRRAREMMRVAPILEMDLRLARLMCRQADFAEGVRAVLVDKDQAPHWSPRVLEAVDLSAIGEALGPGRTAASQP